MTQISAEKQNIFISFFLNFSNRAKNIGGENEIEDDSEVILF